VILLSLTAWRDVSFRPRSMKSRMVAADNELRDESTLDIAAANRRAIWSPKRATSQLFSYPDCWVTLYPRQL